MEKLLIIFKRFVSRIITRGASIHRTIISNRRLRVKNWTSPSLAIRPRAKYVPYGRVMRVLAAALNIIIYHGSVRVLHFTYNVGTAHVCARLGYHNIYIYYIIYILLMYFYRTYQRQQPDEHVRLADKVLDVELAADFAGPVGLRTSIHICNDRRRRRFTICILLYRRCAETLTPRRARYAGRPTFARYYYIIIINKVAAQLIDNILLWYLSLSQLYLPIWYYIYNITTPSRIWCAASGGFRLVSLFCCFCLCIQNSRIIKRSRSSGSGGGSRERAFGEITVRIDFLTTPLVARNGSAGVTLRGCRRARPQLSSVYPEATTRPANPRTACFPRAVQYTRYMRSLKILYITVAPREGCALTIWSGRSLKRSGWHRRRRSRTNLLPRVNLLVANGS